MKDHTPSPRVVTQSNGLMNELHPPATTFDFMPLIGVLIKAWRQLLVVGVLAALTSLLVALALFRPSYEAAVRLSHFDSPLASEDYRPQTYDPWMLFGLISAPDAVQKAQASLLNTTGVNSSANKVQMTMDRNSSIITVTATSPTAEGAVLLANHIGRQAILFTQELQLKDAQEAAHQIDQQLADSDMDRTQVRQRLAVIEDQRARADLPQLTSPQNGDKPNSLVALQSELSRLYERTQTARDQLDELQARYTQAHPLVREQKMRVAALEAKLSQLPPSNELSPSTPTQFATGITVAPNPVARQSTGYDALAISLNNLESHHTTLINHQRALQPFLHNPPGILSQIEPARLDTVVAKHTAPLVIAIALIGGLAGTASIAAIIVIREFFDDRVKTGQDLTRLTGLPLIGTLGELEDMTPSEKSYESLRIWTTLRGHLSGSADAGIICGFTSAGIGEGRSTWVELIAGSARQCGFTVLVVSTDTATGSVSNSAASDKTSSNLSIPTWGTPEYTAMLVSNPSQLMENKTHLQFYPADSLPLPKDWIWDLERRSQWQRAMQAWRTENHLVILVDLPPMSAPETMLLTEKIPNLVWLGESHKAEAAETIEYIESLRHTGRNLIGTVLNRAPRAGTKPRLARWFGRRSLLFATAFGLAGAPASAATELTNQTMLTPPLSQPADSFTNTASERAPWQQRFILGPGDQLQLTLFGQTESTATSLLIGPDGRVSYLEAQNLMASGLTVDEFRTALNLELGKLRNSPEVLVRPLAYRSKRYYILGAVTKKGSFPLNRPLTLIEAVAQAQGLETRVIDRSLVVQADLTNSFISRQGRHLPVDFKKLFNDGDLSQNIALEPDDYLYFPPAENLQIYVLGEVRFPGALNTQHQTGTLEAIAIRGGFSERAWPKRLLIIRGSLKKPTTFIVNANDVLAAKTPDFQLEPKDIVYVGSRPWYKAEELLDLAATAFVQSAVVTKTGLSVTPIGTR
jgi:protein involved in polysaccharide export with SLBB domain/capsular polysaccharide biosynthesis protein/Mrp family chromosome partitioning ATPase